MTSRGLYRNDWGGQYALEYLMDCCFFVVFWQHTFLHHRHHPIVKRCRTRRPQSHIRRYEGQPTMPRATGQSILEDSSLSKLKRSELQSLAKVRSNLRMVMIINRLTIEPPKTYGVKANGKNQVIIKSLLANKAFVDSRKESITESSKSSGSASVQFSPNTTEARKCTHMLPLCLFELMHNLCRASAKV